MTNIIESPKSISSLQHYTRLYKSIKLSGMNSYIHFNNTSEESILLDTSAIRDYTSYYKAGHTGVIGLNLKLNRLLSLKESEHDTLSPLFLQCLNRGFYLDSWNISILEAIFDSYSPSLISLFLAMINAQIQIIGNALQWVSVRSIINRFGRIEINNFIPIKIKMEIFTNTHYALSAPILKTITQYPVFNQPIIMGELTLNSTNTNIAQIFGLYYYNDTVIYLDKFLKRYIGASYPLTMEQIVSIWKRISHVHSSIKKTHRDYLIQSLIELLSPNLA